jgi:hypothetical protein
MVSFSLGWQHHPVGSPRVFEHSLNYCPSRYSIHLVLSKQLGRLVSNRMLLTRTKPRNVVVC